MEDTFHPMDLQCPENPGEPDERLTRKREIEDRLKTLQSRTSVPPDTKNLEYDLYLGFQWKLFWCFFWGGKLE